MRLVYSPDDAARTGKGWYWERDGDWAVSQSFATREEAEAARRKGRLVWAS
jgi:hypothetical protein